MSKIFLYIQFIAGLFTAITFCFYTLREIFTRCNMLYVFVMLFIAFLGIVLTKISYDELKESNE